MKSAEFSGKNRSMSAFLSTFSGKLVGDEKVVFILWTAQKLSKIVLLYFLTFPSQFLNFSLYQKVSQIFIFSVASYSPLTGSSHLKLSSSFKLNATKFWLLTGETTRPASWERQEGQERPSRRLDILVVRDGQMSWQWTESSSAPPAAYCSTSSYYQLLTSLSTSLTIFSLCS